MLEWFLLPLCKLRHRAISPANPPCLPVGLSFLACSGTLSTRADSPFSTRLPMTRISIRLLLSSPTHATAPRRRPSSLAACLLNPCFRLPSYPFPVSVLHSPPGSVASSGPPCARLLFSTAPSDLRPTHLHFCPPFARRHFCLPLSSILRIPAFIRRSSSRCACSC